MDEKPKPPLSHAELAAQERAEIEANRPDVLQETLSGSFLLLSLKRAFRLQIKPNEVLHTERRALRESAAHVTEPEHQAFLAWRRSVLMVIVVIFTPLTILRFVETVGSWLWPYYTSSAKAMQLLPAFAELLFLLVGLWQLFRWTHWRSQRRVLFIAWALYFLAPYLVYLYPFQEGVTGSLSQLAKGIKVGGRQLFSSRVTQFGFGMYSGVNALIILGPKTISLMPGLIRASIVTKLLFPGSAAPGYVMLMAAPLYALFAYILVLQPYQMTASIYFVVGLLGIMVAQIFIALSGRRLITPLSLDEARERIHKYWLAYIMLLLLSAAIMLVGVIDLVLTLHFNALKIVNAVLSFMGNVLVMTLIGTDAIIANLRRIADIRYVDAAKDHLREDSEAKLRHFCQ